MDFSAWFEVYLGGRWHTFDARHNTPRIGRVLMARGRDAVDVALTTSFGPTPLEKFTVWTEGEITAPASHRPFRRCASPCLYSLTSLPERLGNPDSASRGVEMFWPLVGGSSFFPSFPACDLPCLTAAPGAPARGAVFGWLEPGRRKEEGRCWSAVARTRA